MNNQPHDWYSLLSGFGSKSMDEIGVFPFLGVMAVSLFSAFFIALLYTRFYKARSTGSLIYRAFPLLGMSITAIFIAIQFSLPLSLGLLGALSIVRFRTPVKEPEEIGFIMLVVATSLCCATFNLLFLAIIHLMAIIALLGLRYGGRLLTVDDNDGVVLLEMPNEVFREANGQIVAAVEKNLRSGRLESVAESSTGTVMSYNFKRIRPAQLLQLQEALTTMQPTIKMNFFYNNTQAV